LRILFFEGISAFSEPELRLHHALIEGKRGPSYAASSKKKRNEEEEGLKEKDIIEEAIFQAFDRR